MSALDLSGEDILNAAAVWFLFKAIEVGIFLVYDVYCAITKRRWNSDDPDSDLQKDIYDLQRGRLEYVWSGAGFFNNDLWSQKRVFLLFLSSIIPIAVFVLEMLSVTLGNKTTVCKTSSDLRIIKSPSLVLFGKGTRNGNASSVWEETRSFGGRNLFSISKNFGFPERHHALRPCVSWKSTNAGVQFLSEICADIGRADDHYLISDQFYMSNQKTGLFVFLEPSPFYATEFYAEAFSLQPNSSAKDVWLGGLRFSSQVIVNGKNILYQNAFSNATSEKINKAQKNQLIQDVKVFERYLQQVPSEVVEDGNSLGFVWDNAETYAYSSRALAYGLLAQTTREPIKTAAEMSLFNTENQNLGDFDISCKEDFKLPRLASIIIISLCTIYRLIVHLIPTPISSVEFALKKSEEDLSLKEGVKRQALQQVASKNLIFSAQTINV